MLTALKAGGYRFARYGETNSDRHVIWRHDVDYSMHRAVRLAEIEAVENAFATYFVNPRCSFYNLLEVEIAEKITRIRELGHEIGLHFDVSATAANWTLESLERAVMRDRSILESIIGTSIRCVSWHNPDQSNALDFANETIAGLVNAYGDGLRTRYKYCSDSNGYWRFQPMRDVIAQGHEHLHLLTHPEWWTPEPMSPSERIDRALSGRAAAGRRDYDALLSRSGRRNIV